MLIRETSDRCWKLISDIRSPTLSLSCNLFTHLLSQISSRSKLGYFGCINSMSLSFDLLLITSSSFFFFFSCFHILNESFVYPWCLYRIAFMLLERVARGVETMTWSLRASARREGSIYPHTRRRRADHLFCFFSRETNLCLVIIGSINIHGWIVTKGHTNGHHRSTFHFASWWDWFLVRPCGFSPILCFFSQRVMSTRRFSLLAIVMQTYIALGSF